MIFGCFGGSGAHFSKRSRANIDRKREAKTKTEPRAVLKRFWLDWIPFLGSKMGAKLTKHRFKIEVAPGRRFEAFEQNRITWSHDLYLNRIGKQMEISV